MLPTGFESPEPNPTPRRPRQSIDFADIVKTATNLPVTMSDPMTETYFVARRVAGAHCCVTDESTPADRRLVCDLDAANFSRKFRTRRRDGRGNQQTNERSLTLF
jgi:hypothetical protein